MRKLLIIEDNQDDQELLIRHLKKANIEEHIRLIADADQGMEVLLEDGLSAQPEIFAIFLDLNLNGIPGLEVLRLIRSKPELAKLPVIVITGSDNIEDRKACAKLQVVSFITKPINFPSFRMAIANVFHQPVAR
jgi:two-component system response regulator